MAARCVVCVSGPARGAYGRAYLFGILVADEAKVGLLLPFDVVPAVQVDM